MKQKGFAAPLIILGVVVIIIVAAGVFYVQSTQHSLRYFFQPAILKLPPFLQPSVTFNEKYCREFSYQNCPSECEVGPSCPICMDIGCYAKSAPQSNSVSPAPIIETIYETVNWKTYQLKKTYRNGDLKFSINYPSEWQAITGERNVRWYGKDVEDYTFEVSWLSPDVIYDVIGFCAGNSCSKVIEMVVDEGVTMEIWRLNEAVRTQRKLPSTFLHATIKNSEKRVLPEFNTMSLPVDDFKAILSTFKFTD